jgi:hypothetical protein
MKTSTGLLGIILPAFALLAVGCSLPLVTSTANPDRSRAFVESFMLKVVDGRCDEAFEDFDIDSLVIYGRPQGEFYRGLPVDTQARYRKDLCEGIYAGLFRNRPPEEALYAVNVSPDHLEVVEVSASTGGKRILFLLSTSGRELKIVRVEKGVSRSDAEAAGPRELQVCSLACSFSRIQDAIYAAADADTILVHEGTYEENIDFLGKGITVISRGGAGRTFISGKRMPEGKADSVVFFPPDRGKRAVLDGFTISGGTGSRIMGEIRLLDGPDQGDVGTHGGGISCVDSSPVIRNCVVSGNTAGNGGGVSAWNSGVVIENSVISGNRAFRDGGGVYTASFRGSSTNTSLMHTTVSGNAAGRSGGALSCYWSSPFILNSILWGNTAAGEEDAVKQCGKGARAAYSTINDDGWLYRDAGAPWPGEGNLKTNPLFREALPAGEAPATGGDYRLSPGSPAIDRGQPEGPGRDLDGSPRPQGAGYDMGAYEASAGQDGQGPTPPLPEPPERGGM